MALPSCRPNAAGWRRTSVKQYGHKPPPGYHLGPSRIGQTWHVHQDRNAHSVGQLPTHASPDAEADGSPSPPLEIGFKSCQESAWVSQPPFMRPAHEPSQRAGREIRPLLRGERGKATAALVHRTLRHIRHHTPATHAPCRFRPVRAADELAVVPAVVAPRRGQPSSDPFRYRHGHRVADLWGANSNSAPIFR